MPPAAPKTDLVSKDSRCGAQGCDIKPRVGLQPPGLKAFSRPTVGNRAVCPRNRPVGMLASAPGPGVSQISQPWPDSRAVHSPADRAWNPIGISATAPWPFSQNKSVSQAGYRQGPAGPSARGRCRADVTIARVSAGCTTLHLRHRRRSSPTTVPRSAGTPRPPRTGAPEPPGCPCVSADQPAGTHSKYTAPDGRCRVASRI